MSWFEYPLVALACALCGAIGFFAGAVLVIKAFVDMHNIGLPPAMRPTSIFSKHNLTVGTTCALLYVMAAVILAGIVTGGWFAFASYGAGRGLQ
jgi:hypothetical protein